MKALQFLYSKYKKWVLPGEGMYVHFLQIP